MCCRSPQPWLVGSLALFVLFSPLSAFSENEDADSKAADGYTLRYRFQKDEVLRYQVDHETAITTTKQQFVERVENEVHSRKNHRVVAMDSAGNATLELMIDETQMSATFDDAQPLTFDSRKPADCPPVYQHIRQVVGKPLARMRVSPRGELLSSVPLLAPELLAQANILPPDGDASNDPMRNFLVEFPQEPVKVGEDWTKTFQVKVQVERNLTQNVTLQRRYELVDVKDDVATIKLRTALITPVRDGMILVRLIQMTPSGTIEFDVKQGRLLSRTLTIDKTEVGFIGGDSAMQAKSKRVERWISPKQAAKAEKADARS